MWKHIQNVLGVPSVSVLIAVYEYRLQLYTLSMDMSATFVCAADNISTV